MYNQQAVSQTNGNKDVVSIPGVVQNSGSIMNFLINPVYCPQQVGLTGSVPDGTAASYLKFPDYLGLSDANGQTTDGIAFGVQTGTVAATQKLTSTYALIVAGYNTECDNSLEVGKALTVLNNSIDGSGDFKPLFASLGKSMFQNDPNILNIRNAFVWTYQTALKFNTAANNSGAAVSYLLTLNILGAVPYSQLPEFLAANRIFQSQVLTGLGAQGCGC